MKVELDLSALQLKMLDESMTKLLENLSEEQKMTIVSNYINHKFDNLEVKSNFYNDSASYYRNSETELTKFGKELIFSLQEKITKTVSEMVMEHENYNKIIEENTEKIIKKLPEILEKAISNYIAENICTSKDKIYDVVHSEINDIRYRMMNRN